MEILLWLLPAALTTGLAMLFAGYLGRERPDRARTDAEAERFAEAILRPLPPAARNRPRPRERSTGVAVRRSPDHSRRSA